MPAAMRSTATECSLEETVPQFMDATAAHVPAVDTSPIRGSSTRDIGDLTSSPSKGHSTDPHVPPSKLVNNARCEDEDTRTTVSATLSDPPGERGMDLSTHQDHIKVCLWDRSALDVSATSRLADF